jgi:prevent-host-death family protein
MRFAFAVGRDKWLSTANGEGCIDIGMIVTAEVGTRQLADLIKQVQAGNEVLLTQGNKPVAKIVSASENGDFSGMALNIRSIKGHQVLTPVISQGELAEEMFGRQ